MKILPIHPDLVFYLKEHQLIRKFEKQKKLFEQNPLHSGLNTEVLKPKKFKIYSFRIDRKYRAIFVYQSENFIEIVDINNHYQ
jgi:Txe/YoeB family toxin of Txe-Axe toxin-antitoxin module